MSQAGTTLSIEALSEKEQREILARVARSLSRRLRERLPNVVSVGAGYRVREGTRTQEPVLQVLVAKKWKAKGRKGEVPRVVTAYLRRGRARVRVRVPTDVDPVGEGGPQAAVTLSGGIWARCDPVGLITADKYLSGAVAAVVTRDPPDGRQFLLSCHHVLTCSMLRNAFYGGWDALEGARAEVPSAAVVGPTVRWTTLSPGGTRYGMDAALAQVWASGGVSSSVQGVRPLAVATEDAALDTARLFTPRGSIPCDFASVQADLSLPYDAQTRIRFRQLIRYFPTNATANGDSGSPLVDSKRTLLGMHVWGGEIADKETGTPRAVGYAVPAWALFSSGLFDDVSRLKLAP